MRSLLNRTLLHTTLVALTCLPFHNAASITAATTHPFHATALQLDWNSESHCFEAALQLPGTTLEEELTRIAGRPVNLDAAKPETLAKNEKLLENWIRARLKLSAPERPGPDIHWVGFETEQRSVWAYFEIRIPADNLHPNPPHELNVHCSFFQHIPGQINAVTVNTPKLRGSTILTELKNSSNIPLSAK